MGKQQFTEQYKNTLKVKEKNNSLEDNTKHTKD